MLAKPAHRGYVHRRSTLKFSALVLHKYCPIKLETSFSSFIIRSGMHLEQLLLYTDGLMAQEQ